jgi:hypothetical protein
MLRLAAVVVLFFAVSPASAWAASAGTGDQAGLFVGQQVWGAPACGDPHVEVSTPADYERDHGTGNFASPEPLAWADVNRCVIVINAEVVDGRYAEIHTAQKRCHVIVHEWGHLVGEEHVNNPRSVMYGHDNVSEGWGRFGKKRPHWEAFGAFKPCYPAVEAVLAIQRTR